MNTGIITKISSILKLCKCILKRCTSLYVIKLIYNNEGMIIMTENEMFKLMNENPVFHLATVDGDQPRVRGMLLFRADKNGIIFHTASTKDVFAQIMKIQRRRCAFRRRSSAQGNGRAEAGFR